MTDVRRQSVLNATVIAILQVLVASLLGQWATYPKTPPEGFFGCSCPKRVLSDELTPCEQLVRLNAMKASNNADRATGPVGFLEDERFSVDDHRQLRLASSRRDSCFDLECSKVAL